MLISELLLPEFDEEMANTRKVLERVPYDRADWKPHEKSMTMGRLAGHVAEMPSWATTTIQNESWDLAPKNGSGYQPLQATSREQTLKIFDEHVAAARKAIASASDEHLAKSWSLLQGGNAILTLPRFVALRSFVMNHIIHHRAQLGVYLRLNNLPVPGLYGPSADDRGM